MSARIGDVVVTWYGADGFYARGNCVVRGIPRATLLRWACEEIARNRMIWLPAIGADEYTERWFAPDEIASAALLLCEAIGTDEADSLEEWG